MALISKWRMRGDATDSISGKNGVTNGAVTYEQSGPTGYSAYFPGLLTAWINIPDDNVFSSTDQRFTLSAWINPTNATYNTFFYCKGTSNNYEWAASLGSGKSNALKYTLGGASGYSSLSSNVSVFSGKWHNMIYSWNNNYPIIYVNGLAVPTTIYNTATPAAQNGTAPVTIGKRGDNISQFLGRITDVTYRSHFVTAGMAKNEYIFYKGFI